MHSSAHQSLPYSGPLLESTGSRQSCPGMTQDRNEREYQEAEMQWNPKTYPNLYHYQASHRLENFYLCHPHRAFVHSVAKRQLKVCTCQNPFHSTLLPIAHLH